MFIYEIILFILTFFITAGVPLYIFFRERMVDPKRKQNLSKNRVFKITSLNMSLNIIVYIIFLSIWGSILFKTKSPGVGEIYLSALFLVITGLSFYGNGIYVTSVVLEAFTLPQLKSLNYFKTQFIATHLFHGPISHVLIYSGYFVAFFLLGLLDFQTGQSSSSVTSLLLGCGVIVGIFYTWAQIFNGTLAYQFLTCLISFIIFITLLYLKGLYLFDFSVASFLFSFSVTFLISGSLYFLFRVRDKNNVWDSSGY